MTTVGLPNSTFLVQICARKVEFDYDASRMLYERKDFIQFSVDAGRVIANLEMAYMQWLEAQQAYLELPATMFWQSKSGTDYLAYKDVAGQPGTTLGVRSPETESRLQEFTNSRTELKKRIHAADQLMRERAAQYRALRLPVLPDRQGEILRKLDSQRLLRNDLLVVGTNAFAAYELACNARFPVGNEETEDFDLAWCRDTRISLATIAPTQARLERPSLFSLLHGIDNSFKINPKKRCQAVNKDGYEVELLAAPSTHPLPGDESFDPMASLVEQEWLLLGNPISCVSATLRGRACPLFVPDPRWMALHKLWLSQKTDRNPVKKPKDERQGNVLLDATRYFLADTYPLDMDFVIGLPEELQSLFNEWASSRGFDPSSVGEAWR